jgi:hypothetical protein
MLCGAHAAMLSSLSAGSRRRRCRTSRSARRQEYRVAMPMMAPGRSRGGHPNPAQDHISAFGRGRGTGSAPLSKAMMIRGSRKVGARMISRCTARAASS